MSFVGKTGMADERKFQSPGVMFYITGNRQEFNEECLIRINRGQK
jgi:hypothetical protein